MKNTRKLQSSNISITGKTPGKMILQNALLKGEQKIRMPRSALHKHGQKRIDNVKMNPIN